MLCEMQAPLWLKLSHAAHTQLAQQLYAHCRSPSCGVQLSVSSVPSCEFASAAAALSTCCPGLKSTVCGKCKLRQTAASSG